MPRAGLSPGTVVAAAAALLDAEPDAELSLTRIAAVLGVRTPSLYNHIGGLDDLRRRIAMAGIAELADVMRSAVIGRSGAPALRKLAVAYRNYAIAHPGVYPLTQEARPGDPEYAAIGLRATEPVEATLRSCGVAEDELIHRVRVLRSALHGFVLLETQQGFGLDLDIETTFQHLVAALTDMIEAPSAALDGTNT